MGLLQHGDVIFKSASDTRSIVDRLDVRNLDRLDLVKHCPVLFQKHISGPDIRVHVVGGETFAVIIQTDATDYRYAKQQVGREASYAPFVLSRDVAKRCVKVTHGLGLEVSGIDSSLRRTARTTTTA